MDALDVLLLHWPRCYREWDVDWMDCSTALPDDAEARPLWAESWAALEKLYAEGLVLGIGLSNADAELLGRALDGPRVAVEPQLVQNHFPLDTMDEDVVRLCRERGVVYQAYSVLRDLPSAALNEVRRVQRGAGVPESVPARSVLLRWLVESDVAVVVRSHDPARIADNLKLTFEAEWPLDGETGEPAAHDVLDSLAVFRSVLERARGGEEADQVPDGAADADAREEL